LHTWLLRDSCPDADCPQFASRDAIGSHQPTHARDFFSETNRAIGRARFLMYSWLLLRRGEETSYDGGRPVPLFLFREQLFLSGACERIEFGAPVIFRHTPLGPDPADLLEL